MIDVPMIVTTGARSTASDRRNLFDGLDERSSIAVSLKASRYGPYPRRRPSPCLDEGLLIVTIMPSS